MRELAVDACKNARMPASVNLLQTCYLIRLCSFGVPLLNPCIVAACRDRCHAYCLSILKPIKGVRIKCEHLALRYPRQLFVCRLAWLNSPHDEVGNDLVDRSFGGLHVDCRIGFWQGRETAIHSCCCWTRQGHRALAFQQQEFYNPPRTAEESLSRRGARRHSDRPHARLNALDIAPPNEMAM